MTGNWVKNDGLSQENVCALDVYKEAIQLLPNIGVQHRTTGVYYTQVVGGMTNYAFASESASVIPDPKFVAEWIYVEVSFEGGVSNAQISNEKPKKGGEFGGWIEHNGLTPKNVHALEVYDAAINGIIGAVHRTTGDYYTQVVNGTNYAFASESAPVIPNPIFSPEWVYTYQSLEGVVSKANFLPNSPLNVKEVAEV